MAKFLVSWIAYNNDFVREDGKFKEVNLTGPTYQFHKYFFQLGEYEKHILLYSEEKQELYATHLGTKLRGDFPAHNVEEKLIFIKNIIDLAEVKTKIEAFLLSYSNDRIDIYFSPGTSIMQLSWYLCHQALGLHTRLIQTKSDKFTSTGEPELMEVEVQQSETPVTAILKENRLNNPKIIETDYQITDSIAHVYQRAYLVAQTDKVTVIIRGESGTGKEHLARYIHDNSIRKNESFIAVNCAAMAEDLLESRLFGFKKGSFTGANQDTPGFFSLAQDGTIFLDEVGDISPRMQQSLLRVLQEKEIQPIGNRPEKVDVRVIAATNAPLEKKCQEGSFRWDLYYRLCVAELELPALAERGKNEIALLLDHFIQKKKTELHKAKLLTLTKEVRQLLLNYPFPGNIRELENLVESLYVFCPDEVRLEELPKRLKEISKQHSVLLKDVESEHIQKVLKQKNGNQRQTAIALGISLNTLKAKIRDKELIELKMEEQF